MIMRRNPCHDTDNPAGQVNMTNKDIDPNFEFARAQYENDLDLQNAMVYKRLSEVIDKMAREEELFVNGVPRKKMTFDEWVLANKDNKNHPVGYFNLYNVGKGDMDQESYFFFEEIWRAAQENA